MNRKSKCYFLLIDDHSIVRGGVKRIISDNFLNAEFGEASNSAQALELLESKPWDVIILDINLPGRNGIDTLKDIKKNNPKLKVLMLSMFGEEEFAIRALKNGASGYLNKVSVPEELILALEIIMEGKQYLTSKIASLLAEELFSPIVEMPHQKLSDREFEIFLKIADGLTISHIAEELCLSVKTVSTHRSHILSKTGLKNNAEIVKYASRNKLLATE